MSASTKLANALAIPPGDIWQIGPFLTAVRPSWASAISDYATAQRQTPYTRWLSRQYRASEVPISHGSSAVVLHKNTTSPGLPSTALNGAVFTDTSIAPSVPWTTNSSMPVSFGDHDGVAGAHGFATAGEFNGERVIVAGACEPLLATAIKFMGRPLGPRVSITADYRSGKPTMTVPPSSAEFFNAVSVVVLDPTTRRDSWVLIEGPAVLTRAELYSGSASYRSEFGYIAATREDVASAIENGIFGQDGLAQAAALRADPGGGLVFAWTGSTFPENPYALVPEWQDVANTLWETDSLDGIDLSQVPARWVAGAEFLGAFTGVPGEFLLDLDEFVATANLPPAVVISLVGQSVSWSASSDCPPIDQLPAAVRALRIAGSTVSLYYDVDASLIRAYNITAIMAAIDLALPQTGYQLTDGADRGAIGRAVVGALLKPPSAEQRKVMSMILKPGFIDEILAAS